MKKISKLLSVILALAMVMSFAFVVSAEETEITFTKVAATELTAGTYLIYGTSANTLPDGGNTAFMTTEGSNDTRLWGTQLTIDGDTVTTSDSAAMWELIDAEGGFYIKSVAEGVYLYWNSEKGGNKIYKTTSMDEASVWTVAEVDKESGSGYTLAQADGRGLSCNVFGGSDKYLGFAAYDYATTSCACLLEFYVAGEAAPQPAGPIDCEIPGTLTYTFETDDAASAGVMFQWTATADGELSVAKMGEGYMSNVQINGTYGEIGNEGFVVKTGDVVTIIVYGYGAGTVSVPVEFVTGSQGEASVGTAENPEVITSLAAGIEKTLESGEYYFQYTAPKAGELTITTNGDGTHNMEITVNGDNTKVYSNWDNDGAFITLTVAEGDVLTIKVYFDYPGAGTIYFTSDFDAEQGGPVVPAVPSIADGKYVISWNGLTFAALGEDKNYGYAPAGDVNALTDADYITIVNAGDGMFTMQDCYGRYIYMSGNYNSFNVSAELPESGYLWVLEEVEGGYLLKNVEKEKYIAYSADYSTWGCYPTDKSEPGVVTITAFVDEDPNQPTGDAIFAVLAVLAASGLGLTVVASKKN